MTEDDRRRDRIVELVGELSELAAGRDEGVYLGMVVGLFCLRAAARSSGVDLDLGTEAEIAELHDVVWQRLDEASRQRLERLIELCKASIDRWRPGASTETSGARGGSVDGDA